jgi:hypothetical protein
MEDNSRIGCAKSVDIQPRITACMGDGGTLIDCGDWNGMLLHGSVIEWNSFSLFIRVQKGMEHDSLLIRIRAFRIILSVLGGAIVAAMLWIVLAGKYGIVLSQSVRGLLVLGIACTIVALVIYALTKPPKTSVPVGAAEKQIALMRRRLQTLEKKR